MAGRKDTEDAAGKNGERKRREPFRDSELLVDQPTVEIAQVAAAITPDVAVSTKPLTGRAAKNPDNRDKVMLIVNYGEGTEYQRRARSDQFWVHFREEVIRRKYPNRVPSALRRKPGVK